MSQHTDTDRDQQLLASLDPETARLLFPERFAEPIEVTLVCARLDTDTATAVAAMVTEARVEVDSRGEQRLTFTLAQLEALYETYTLLEQKATDLDVLLDGKEVPMVRELWLPLMWGLLS